MTADEFRRMAHPSEPSRFLLAMCVTASLALFLCFVVIVGLPSSLFGIGLILLQTVIASWLGTNLMLARLKNNAVRVGPNSFPEIYATIEDAKRQFNYVRRVECYVHDGSAYNLMLLNLFRRHMILLNSEVVIDPDCRREVDFMIARFVGASAARHHRFQWFSIFLSAFEFLVVFNFLLMPYERATQYSGDQMGLSYIQGDIDTAMSALLKTMVGRDVAKQVNMKSVFEQERESRGSFFVWFVKALSRFPHTTSRLVNLLRYSQEAFPQQAAAFLARQPVTTFVENPSSDSPHETYLRLMPRDPSFSSVIVDRDLWVGRDSHADLYLEQGSVSRDHASIYKRHDGAFDVRDNGSSNGTYLNAKKIDAGRVVAGDTLSFGDVDYSVV